MNYLEANVGGDSILNTDNITMAIEYILNSDASYDQIWFNYMRHPSKTTIEVTFFPYEVSSKFKVGFITYNKALEFINKLPVVQKNECNGTTLFRDLQNIIIKQKLLLLDK